MDNLRIRNLKVEDADEVSRIFAAITQTIVNLDYARIIEDQIRTDEPTSFVAEIDGKVVGFMICEIISGGFGLLVKSAWIVMFGIEPNFMGQGIG